MNIREAREILERHSKEGHFSDIDKHGYAEGYIAALEGEEVKILIEGLEYISTTPQNAEYASGKTLDAFKKAIQKP